MPTPSPLRRIARLGAGLLVTGATLTALGAPHASASPAPDCSAETAAFVAARDAFRPASAALSAARAQRDDALAAYRIERTADTRATLDTATAARADARQAFDPVVVMYRSTRQALDTCKAPIAITTTPVVYSPSWNQAGAPVTDVTVRGLTVGALYMIETPDFCGSLCGPVLTADVDGIIGYHPEFPVGDCAATPSATTGTINIIRWDTREVVATQAVDIPVGTCPPV